MQLFPWPVLLAAAVAACSPAPAASPVALAASTAAPAGSAAPPPVPSAPAPAPAAPPASIGARVQRADEPVSSDWDELASKDAPADADIAAVVLVVLGDGQGVAYAPGGRHRAFPLYCFDRRHGVLVRGAACLRSAPGAATFESLAKGVRGRLSKVETACADGPEGMPERLPAYWLEAPLAPGVEVLLLTRAGAAPPIDFVAGRSVRCGFSCPPVPPFSLDVDRDGRAETVTSDREGLSVLFADRRALSQATRSGETGPFGVLAVADLDRDGEPELVLQRDLGGLWELVVAELGKDAAGRRAYRGVARIGCGELG